MAVTDAEVTAALNIWNSMPGSDRKVLRAVLENFEAERPVPAEPEPDPSELGSILISLSAAEDGKPLMGSTAFGHLDYYNIRAMLAMASETESVRRMAEELGA